MSENFSYFFKQNLTSFCLIFNKLILNKYSTLEQFANVTTLVFTRNDNIFYWYQKIKNVSNFKNIFKIRHSPKLRRRLTKNYQFPYSINFIQFFLFNIKNFNLDLFKYNFLNWWGRVKKLKLFAKNFTHYYLFYFYKFNNFYQITKYCEKYNSTQKKLLTYNVLLIYYSIENTFLFLPPMTQNFNFTTYYSNFFQTAKPKFKKLGFFRSFPWVALELSVRKIIYFNWNFMFFKSIILRWDFLPVYLEGLTKLFYSYTIIPIGKSLQQLSQLRILIGIFYKYSKLLSSTILGFNLFLIYLFLLLTKPNFIFFLENFLFLILNDDTFLNSNLNINFNQLLLFRDFKIKSLLTTTLFNYKGIEWFLKSYLFTWKIKKKIFLYYQGYTSTNFHLSLFFFYQNTQYTEFKYLYDSYHIAKPSQYWSKFFFKKKFTKLPSSLLLNKFIFQYNFINVKLNDNLIALASKKYKTLFFITTKFLINKFLYFFTHLINFSLSFFINYGLLFNRYYHLDVFSCLENIFFFYWASFYNIIFFYNKIYTTNYIGIFLWLKLILNFEVNFFKKVFFFWATNNVFTNFNRGFTLYLKLLTYLPPWKKKKFNKLVWVKYWFNYKTFIEELNHLALESIYTDYERVQELIWTNQLAELRLVKLTNFLKKMRDQNITVGNIQYSPDFTQKHELALTLKWGLELELLWFTRIIALWRYFGRGKIFFKTNFIWKKISFLYNFKKIKFKNFEKNSNFNFFKTWVFKLLSLKSVYEFTKLHLATIVASYRNIYKDYYFQPTTIHKIFSLTNEKTIKELYGFISLSFERKFFISSYKKYYLKTKIKRKIWFFKMLNKIVYRKFTMSTNFFRSLAWFKNSFNYYFFLLFRKIKKNITKKIKNSFFYNYIYNIVSKHFWTYYLPTKQTIDDFWFYVINRQNLISFTNKKFFLFFKKNKIKFFYKNYFLQTLQKKKNIKQNLSYLYLFKSNFFKIYNYYSLCFFSFNPTINFNNFSTETSKIFENIYISFFSEFVYDQLVDFFSTLKLENKNNKNFNKFFNHTLYETLATKNFSFSFFNFLNVNTTGLKHLKNFSQIKYLEILFRKKFLSPKTLIIFINLLKKYLIRNLIDTKSYHQYFLILTNNFIKIFFKNQKIRINIISNALLWLTEFFKTENFDVTLKNILFNTYWLNTFSSSLEHIIILFIKDFCKIIYKN